MYKSRWCAHEQFHSNVNTNLSLNAMFILIGLVFLDMTEMQVNTSVPDVEQFSMPVAQHLSHLKLMRQSVKHESHLLSFAFVLSHPFRKTTSLHLKKRKEYRVTLVGLVWFSGRRHFAFVAEVCVPGVRAMCVCHRCPHKQRQKHFAYHSQYGRRHSCCRKWKQEDLDGIKEQVCGR